MAISVNRSIVTDGLVAYFDVASPRSYTGALPLVDLSTQCSNTTGVSPSYTGVNNGALAFNGTSHYLGYLTNSALPNKITIEMWFKLTGSISDSMIFGFNSHGLYYNTHLGYNTGAGDIYGISSTTFNSLGFENNWRQGVFIMNSNISYTNNKMYVNTSGQTLSAQNANAENTSNRNFNNGNGAIGSWLINQLCTPMQFSIFRIYNRELSQAEINQNFEANRTRFGI